MPAPPGGGTPGAPPSRPTPHNGGVNEPIPVIRDVDRGTARLLPDVDRDRAWLLTVDGAPQSYVDLDDPAHLEFEYVQRLAHVLDTAAAAGEPLDVLHLGGGALTLPRYTAATRPGSRQRVAEADRGLLDLVAEVMPLPDGSGIAVHAEDARELLERTAPDSVDVLIADVFGGSRVPAHLTSVEYARAAGRVLRRGGIYAANLADSAPFDFLRSQLSRLRRRLPGAGGRRRTRRAARPAFREHRAAGRPRAPGHRRAHPALRGRRLPRAGRARPGTHPPDRTGAAGRRRRGGRLTRAAPGCLHHRLRKRPVGERTPIRRERQPGGTRRGAEWP